MKRFGLCLAVAVLVVLATPGGGPQTEYVGSETFFRLAARMVAVLLLALAFYAATLFVEYVRARRRRP